MRIPLLLASAIAGLAACRGQPLPAPPGGPLSLIPATAGVVVQIDVDRLRPTPLWKALLEESRADRRIAGSLGSLAREGGLDLLTQLESITFASSSPPDMESTLCILQGKFDEDRLLEWGQRETEAHGSFGWAMIPVSYRGVRYYETGIAGGAFEAVFLGQSIIAVGTRGWARKVIDVVQGRERAAQSDADFAPLLQPPPAPAAAWFAARWTGGDRATATGNIAVADGFSGRVHASGTSDSQEAAMQQRVADFLNGIRNQPGYAKLGAKELIDRVSLARAGADLDVSLSLSPAEVDAAIVRIDRVAKGRGVESNENQP